MDVGQADFAAYLNLANLMPRLAGDNPSDTASLKPLNALGLTATRGAEPAFRLRPSVKSQGRHAVARSGTYAGTCRKTSRSCAGLVRASLAFSTAGSRRTPTPSAVFLSIFAKNRPDQVTFGHSSVVGLLGWYT